ISALILWQIRARFSERPASTIAPVTAEKLIPYARAHPRVLALLISKGGYGMGAGTVALLSVFGREVFKAGAFGIGLLFAARGLGIRHADDEHLQPDRRSSSRSLRSDDRHDHHRLAQCVVGDFLGCLDLATLAIGALPRACSASRP